MAARTPVERHVESRRSQHLDSVKVYPLAHIRIEVAMDISFAKDGRPSRGTMQSATGPLQAMPRAPDDFSSGPKLAYYEKGAYGTVRVFVELDKANDTQVAAVHVDVDGVVRLACRSLQPRQPHFEISAARCGHGSRGTRGGRMACCGDAEQILARAHPLTGISTGKRAVEGDSVSTGSIEASTSRRFR
jgi:hypothetical protein